MPYLSPEQRQTWKEEFSLKWRGYQRLEDMAEELKAGAWLLDSFPPAAQRYADLHMDCSLLEADTASAGTSCGRRVTLS